MSAKSLEEVPCVPMDPRHPVTFSNRFVKIPEPTWKLNRLLERCRTGYLEPPFDAEDLAVLNGTPTESGGVGFGEQAGAEIQARVEDDWVHDSAWVAACVQHMLPPPTDASPMAVSSVQRELTAMLKEQEKAKSLRELGWHMPVDFVGDNLFQWIVELHSFDLALPVAQDMAAR
jgi:ubiquitin-conjugating enzyme E2 Q